MADLSVYLSLFGIALAAASILPLQSEAVLVALLLAGNQPVWLLLMVATLGNTAGSAINWLLGCYLEHYRDRPWFPVKGKSLKRAKNWYHRYGKWSLLLSWLPVIGDPLTLVAGVLQEPFPTFILLVAIAKFLRYLVLAMLTLGMMTL